MSTREGTASVDENLLAGLGLDAHDPEVVEGLEDAAALVDLVNDLVALRQALGIVQRQVAERMSTTQSAISDFERIGGDPRLSTVQRYARALGARLALDLDTTKCWDGRWHPVAYNTGQAAPWVAVADRERWPVQTDDFALAA
jgi:transcriptional regulator with XRE-family HTH domain